MNPNPLTSRSGGHLVADALITHGVDTAFGVPGESYLAVLDGLYAHNDAFKFIICRQEGGAAYMAEAYAKLTGKPGVCLVTRGPGATNAAIGVHTAHQDSSPMILLIGQVGNDFVEREAFQEIDYRRMFGPMAKWVAQIDDASRVPEYMAHAFQTATSGRPGPVVLALPEDMLSAYATVADARRFKPVRASPSAAQMARVGELLSGAQRPFVIVGGHGWSRDSAKKLREFSEALSLPVGCAFRFQDTFDNRHPNYAGDVGIGINPKLAERIKSADVVLCIGARLGEMTTSGYTLFDVPIPKQTLIHVHGDPNELGRVYQADEMICSGIAEFCAMLGEVTKHAKRIDSSGALRQIASELVAWQSEPPLYTSRSTPAALNLYNVVQTIKKLAPSDAIITNGAGNFATWAHRFFPYAGVEHCDKSQLAPTSGAMGYGVPAAVMASIVAPERTVLNFAGDGDFMMTSQELATAMQYGGAPICIVFNNGMYGTIRMHQEKHFPQRVYGTQLANPDFAKYCESFGGKGFTVTTNAEFDAAFAAALTHTRTLKTPALIELKVDPQDLTPGATLAAITASAQR
ncbi:MAG: thiamine pyrophosphate-binding protein [Betaproteobacteria bacterium]|nr:MAG: thiamine pyrophosphate-binding protein [Betaproteobacteria bacterium]